ncbi:MAG: 2Fe-2S iron-sulfur cluster-binding protein [Alphaproteobacteria bacterium]
MKIFVTDPDGARHTVEAVEGWRVMEIIRDSGFPIKAECGGACACATCHVYVDEQWISKIPAMRDEEDYMLDEAFDRRENSRLSCQIIMSEELDGLEVTLGRDHD